MSAHIEREDTISTSKIDPAKAIAETLGVEFDGEAFRIKTHFSNGTDVTHVVLGRDHVGGVPIEDYIRAVQKFYPTIEHGSEFDPVAAVQALKNEEGGNKNKKAAENQRLRNAPGFSTRSS
jgi:hypothetical protein